MRIERIEITKINPAKYNPRKDLKPGDPEYEKLKRSIQEFDIVEPLVWNERTGNLVGGHQRLKILEELGHTEAEVSVVDMDEQREKALNIALNKISGEWDMPKLQEVLKEIGDSGFDATLTGFTAAEIEELFITDNPEVAKGERDDSPPIMTIRFEKPEDVRAVEDDLREIFERKYPDISVSISCGEI